MTFFGVDASDFNGTIYTSNLYKDGIRFFTHKATEGTKTIHVNYGSTMNYAKNNGFKYLGPYVVPRTPGNYGHGTVAEQLNYFMNYVNDKTPWWKTFPGWFWQVDLEKWSSNGIVYDAVSPAVGNEMCDRLSKVSPNKKVILYAPKWAYSTNAPAPWPLWASYYGSNAVQHYKERYAALGGDSNSVWNTAYGASPARKPTIWQFGSRLSAGSNTTIDVNAFRGTETDFANLIGADMQVDSFTTTAMAQLTKYFLSMDGWIENHRGDPTNPTVATKTMLTFLGQDILKNREVVNALATQIVEAIQNQQVNVTLSPEMEQDIVDKVTAALIAAPDVPLSAQNQDTIKNVVKAAMREGSGN